MGNLFGFDYKPFSHQDLNGKVLKMIVTWEDDELTGIRTTLVSGQCQDTGHVYVISIHKEKNDA
jgi:hypothetical protein